PREDHTPVELKQLFVRQVFTVEIHKQNWRRVKLNHNQFVKFLGNEIFISQCLKLFCRHCFDGFYCAIEIVLIETIQHQVLPSSQYLEWPVQISYDRSDHE